MSEHQQNIKGEDFNYFRKKVSEWGSENYYDYPWRSTSNLFHAIVAEIMLQRTKAEQVLPVYEDFVMRFQTPQDFYDHLSKTDENIFRNLGLTWRHERFKRTVSYFLEYGIPVDRNSLLTVPGIGDYVTSAVLSFHLRRRAVLIDGNIVRLYGRFFGFSFNNETRKKKWLLNLAESITPSRNVRKFNYAILDFAMKMCGKEPNCHACRLLKRCNYNKNEVGQNK